MNKRKYAASVSHTEETIEALRTDRELAVEYLKAALEELDDPENRAAGLLALRDIAEARGGLSAIAAEGALAGNRYIGRFRPKATRL